MDRNLNRDTNRGGLGKKTQAKAALSEGNWKEQRYRAAT
jgi:hypothetical protein